MRLIDLSVPILNQPHCEVDQAKPQINYFDHIASVPGMLEMFPGSGVNDLPGGKAWAYEMVTLQTHSGTHLDAPYHYGPFMDDGMPTMKIGDINLEWCFSDAVMLDFSQRPPEIVLTAKDYQDELDRIGYKLRESDIVLVQTGAAKYWGTEKYLHEGVGTGREATLWLIEQGVHLVGTDAWSWDRPLSLTAKEFQHSKDSSIIWEGHFAGLKKPYCHIEKLANLDQLPHFGFQVACFPIHVQEASAGWVRAVAILP